MSTPPEDEPSSTPQSDSDSETLVGSGSPDFGAASVGRSALALRGPRDSRPSHAALRRQDDRAPRSHRGILRVAEMLLAGDDNPLTYEGRRRLELRDVPHFYSPLVVGGALKRMKLAVENGGRLYLQGSRSGAGTTMLIADFVTAFNLLNTEHGDGRQILHVDIAQGTNSAAQFLDDIGAAADVPLSSADIRRGKKRLIQQLIVGMRSLHASTLVLDHVHFLGPKVLPLLKTIIDATDPAKTGARAESAGEAQEDRLGVILVSHVHPRSLFGRSSSIRHALRGCHAVLPTYDSTESIADALRMAQIGLDDLSLDTAEDICLVERVHAMTQGVPAAMEPLFQILDALSQRNGGARPDVDMLECARDYYAEELAVRGRGPGLLRESPVDAEAQAYSGARRRTLRSQSVVDTQAAPTDPDTDTQSDAGTCEADVVEEAAHNPDDGTESNPGRRTTHRDAGRRQRFVGGSSRTRMPEFDDDGNLVERAERANALKRLNRSRAGTAKIGQRLLRGRS